MATRALHETSKFNTQNPGKWSRPEIGCHSYMTKRAKPNLKIRYSEAFKMAVVRELEQEDLPYEGVRRKYGIRGCGTVQEWARKYGNGSRGIRIRVEKMEEI